MKEDNIDPRFVNVDPLRDTYHESIVSAPEQFRRDHLERAALLCIDMQYLDAAAGFGVFADAEQAGVPFEAQEYYFNQLEHTVLPNVREFLRSAGILLQSAGAHRPAQRA